MSQYQFHIHDEENIKDYVYLPAHDYTPFSEQSSSPSILLDRCKAFDIIKTKKKQLSH